MNEREPRGGRATELWVFGYGSLMWNPGFPHLEARPALLRGYHRALCIYSHQYRGTPERPGLVLGLMRGGSCRGLAFRVAAQEAESVLAYLHEREMGLYVYRARTLPVSIGDRVIQMRGYVADHTHPHYAGKLSLERMAEIVARGAGARGPNVEYLENTVRHLDELGIDDGPLHRVLALLRARG